MQTDAFKEGNWNSANKKLNLALFTLTHLLFSPAFAQDCEIGFKGKKGERTQAASEDTGRARNRRRPWKKTLLPGAMLLADVEVEEDHLGTKHRHVVRVFFEINRAKLAS